MGPESHLLCVCVRLPGCGPCTRAMPPPPHDYPHLPWTVPEFNSKARLLVLNQKGYYIQDDERLLVAPFSGWAEAGT